MTEPTVIVNYTKSGKEATHGTLTNYTRGCRCKDCSEKNSEYKKEYKRRARKKASERPEVIPHGTSHGYFTYKCRCEECLKAARETKFKSSRKREPRVTGRYNNVPGRTPSGRQQDICGTVARYKYQGCRCSPCKAANTESHRQYRERREGKK